MASAFTENLAIAAGGSARRLLDLSELLGNRFELPIGLPIGIWRQRLSSKEQTLAPNQDIVREGDRPTRCIFMLAGLACSSKDTERGDRQIIALHIAGDFPDLCASIFSGWKQHFVPSRSAAFASIDHNALRLFKRHPSVGLALSKRR